MNEPDGATTPKLRPWCRIVERQRASAREPEPLPRQTHERADPRARKAARECRTGTGVTLSHSTPPPTAIVRVGARIEATGLPRETELAICRMLTYSNPEFGRRERLGLSTSDTDPTVTTWARVPGGVSIPRGAGRRLVTLLRQHGISYTVEDATVAPTLDLALTPGTLRPYQVRALDALLAYRTGVLEAPTGCGKTNVLLSAIARLQTTALVLVHTRELVRQTVERCQSWLGVDAGVLGGGRWVVRPITVASVQTLVRRDLNAIASQFGVVLVDEAHHAPARQHATVLDALPARYRYGFSATPWRKDGLDMVIGDYLGDTTARVSPAEVLAAGATVPPRFEVVPTAFEHDLDDAPNAWSAMITALTENTARNQVLTEIVRDRVTAGATVVVLTDRVAHVDLLGDLLEDLAPVCLHGDLPRGIREARMSAVRAGAPLTLATAALLGEGIDAPAWDTLIMASPFAGGPRTLQAVGRVVRPAPGKREALVIDLLDERVDALQAAYRQRARLYREAA